MTTPRPPDWRSRLWVRARHAVIAPITPGAKRAVLTLLVVTLALFGANLLFTARQVDSTRAAIRAQCHFNYDLAGVPLTVNPKTGKASLLGVKIVADSRLAWRGLGCPGVLPPPSPSFVRWATFYHLPAD